MPFVCKFHLLFFRKKTLRISFFNLLFLIFRSHGSEKPVELKLHTTKPNSNCSQLLYMYTSLVLGITCLLFCTVSCILFLKLRKAHRRPKIHRRIVVSRNSESQSSSVCEMIDIENCCNGTNCETVSKTKKTLHNL